ncbi:MAG: hypothetical protein ACK55Z_19885, partial [bacterium]
MYTTFFRLEIHRLVLKARFVSEVQRLSFLDNSLYFTLALFGRHTKRLSKTIERRELETVLRRLMPESSPSVSVVKFQTGWQVQ